jgi:hypothetical protein
LRTTHRVLARAAAGLTLALLLSACGSDNNPTTPGNGGSSGERSTETFNGTLAPRSGSWHTFTVTAAGSIDVTLTTLTAPANTAVGVGIGTTPTNGCDVQAWNNASVQGTLITAPINAGTFCVMVYDVGNLTGDVTYTVTVIHP